MVGPVTRVSTLLTSVQRIQLSRLLTRIGDQAWDFGVPLTLVVGGPGGLRIAALYSFGRSAGLMMLMPACGRLLDRWRRRSTARLGTGMQALGVGVAGALLGLVPPPARSGFWLCLLTLSGIGSALGATLMEIAVASDLLPTVVPKSELTKANSRLKQIDLATEVGVPVLAGLLLAWQPRSLPEAGFLLIALLNMLSFYPEYWLLASVFGQRPELDQTALATTTLRVTLRTRLTADWRTFRRQPAFLSMLAFACLWFTILSPHGTVLTGFLKEDMHVPEIGLGAFRGLGALFGLAATAIFPRLVSRIGLVRSARAMICRQATMVAAALVAFLADCTLGFLGAILLSRVGMYGFALGEAEIRQRTILPGQRGMVNGAFAAITSLVSLALGGASALFASKEQFMILVGASVVTVGTGALLFTVWSRDGRSHGGLTDPMAAE